MVVNFILNGGLKVERERRDLETRDFSWREMILDEAEKKVGEEGWGSAYMGNENLALSKSANCRQICDVVIRFGHR